MGKKGKMGGEEGKRKRKNKGRRKLEGKRGGGMFISRYKSNYKDIRKEKMEGGKEKVKKRKGKKEKRERGKLTRQRGK